MSGVVLSDLVTVTAPLGGGLYGKTTVELTAETDTAGEEAACTAGKSAATCLVQRNRGKSPSAELLCTNGEGGRIERRNA